MYKENMLTLTVWIVFLVLEREVHRIFHEKNNHHARESDARETLFRYIVYTYLFLSFDSFASTACVYAISYVRERN